MPDINDETDLELLDIEDQAKEVGKLTPREYAKLRGLAPQLMYYYIRNKQIETEYCICGRKVIDVKTTDAFFETRRKNDHRSDQERNSSDVGQTIPTLSSEEEA